MTDPKEQEIRIALAAMPPSYSISWGGVAEWLQYLLDKTSAQDAGIESLRSQLEEKEKERERIQSVAVRRTEENGWLKKDLEKAEKERDALQVRLKCRGKALGEDSD